MNEQEIKDNIKIGVKTPSPDFTDKVMNEISTLQKEMPVENNWKFSILVLACGLLLILSIFISLPGVQFFHFTIGFSPVIMPIISLIFVFVILLPLYDLRIWMNAKE